MNGPKEQHEFDELNAVVVHLLTDDGKHAICSGLPVDPRRSVDNTKMLRKQCQACYLAERLCDR